MRTWKTTLVAAKALRLGIASLACAVVFASLAGAEPVRSVVTAPAGDGALEFCTDLTRLWKNRYDPTPEHLAVRALAGAEARLHAVSHGRADFAVVDVGVAVRALQSAPRLTALAVLWPTRLHAVTRNPRVRELGLPVRAETWFFEGAETAWQVFSAETRRAPAQRALLYRMDENLLLDALAYAKEPVVLFGGPAPAAELVQALGRDATLRLLPISGKLLEEFRLAYPWMTTEKMPSELYPNQDRPVEAPAVYQVLVGRRDLPTDSARKVLDTVYGRGNALALFNPLFAQTDPRMNAVFAKLLPFHPATARRFNFTPALP